jgi:hypothetical protein
MHPMGAFRIPEDWLAWDRQFHDNLHLSRGELEKVKDGAGEWDTEYGQVVNAALPFEDCAAHVGGEGWGLQGDSFGDLQMRGYLSDRSKQQLEKQISEGGFAAARALPNAPSERQLDALFPRHSDAPPTIERSKAGAWDKVVITYLLWYGDYGGTAHVEFYLRSVNGHTAVLVFMHAGGQNEAIQQILQSFTWQ